MRLTKERREYFARVLSENLRRDKDAATEAARKAFYEYAAVAWKGIEELPAGWVPEYSYFRVQPLTPYPDMHGNYQVNVPMRRGPSYYADNWKGIGPDALAADPRCADAERKALDMALRAQRDAEKQARDGEVVFERTLASFNTIKQLEKGWPEGYKVLLAAGAIASPEASVGRSCSLVQQSLLEKATALLPAIKENTQ